MHDINRSNAATTRRWTRRVRALGVGLLLIGGTASPLHSSERATQSSGDQPVAATAGGWRLAVKLPSPGGVSAPQAVICYEVTGPTREPTLALEITPIWPGAGPAADAIRADVTVGRSSVIADLSGLGDGTFDLRVQLVANGTAAGRPALLIPGVTLRAGTPPGTCAWTAETPHHP